MFWTKPVMTTPLSLCQTVTRAQAVRRVDHADEANDASRTKQITVLTDCRLSN